ncbi:LCP family protein [Nocardioides dongkuii]|uniref:LCP family protein n=1 Tax=Nocardioides dongkuii TaxID=2760089 RepID=UPI0015F95BFE|nr:LCP family protein [Nocardioides dongkuii]
MADDEQPPAAPAPADEAPAGRGRRPRRTVLKVVLVTQLVMAILTATTVYFVWNQLENELPPGLAIPRPAGMEKPEAEGPLNILVMGSDDRSCAGCGIDAEAGAGGSDTTMLLHVSADREEAYGVSLPRDAMVDRPACTTADGKRVPGERAVMFNTAFAVGGPLCTVQMVQVLTGVYVDHFIVLDFAGFQDMVDAVDGVTVCLPKEVDDPEHDIYFDAGTQELDGRQSLNYVRERTVLSATGDIGRMKRQQAFLASMVNKVMSANTLSQPTRVRAFLKAVVGSIQVDEDLDRIRDLADLAMQFRRTGLQDIKFVTVPIEEYPLDADRLQWTDDADALWKRMIADEPLGRSFSDGSISAAKPPTSESPAPSSPSSQSPQATEAEQQDREQALANGLCA